MKKTEDYLYIDSSNASESSKQSRFKIPKTSKIDNLINENRYDEALDLIEKTLKKDDLDRGMFKKQPWLKDQVEVNPINPTKLTLPVSVDETISEYVYRKNPKSEKTIIKGQKSEGVNISTKADYLVFFCGLAMVFIGIWCYCSVRDRIFVFNMFGLSVKKEISDRENIKTLRLSDYKVKETIIDISDIYQMGTERDSKGKRIENDANKLICNVFYF